MRTPRTLLLTVALGLLASATCSAQQTNASTAGPSSPSASSPQQDSDILKLLEITKIQRDAAIDKNVLLEGRLADKDQTIKALEGALTGRDEQLKDAKDAIKDRTQVNNGDARVLVMTQDLLAKADDRIHQLEHPGIFDTLFDRRTLIGAVGGYGVCKMSSGGGTTLTSLNPFATATQQGFQLPSGVFDFQRTQAEDRLRNALKAIQK